MSACGVCVTVLPSLAARVGVGKRLGDKERREAAVVDGAGASEVVDAPIVDVLVVAVIGVVVRVVVASNMGWEALTAVDGVGEGERVDWRVFSEAVAEVPVVADPTRGGVSDSVDESKEVAVCEVERVICIAADTVRVLPPCGVICWVWVAVGVAVGAHGHPTLGTL